MIVLTVKTLDSQNHSFTVDDNITVEEFKVKIAESINIPPDSQRIIYCGRVLQDSAKLSEYDVNGKVVHLVQRAPPTTAASQPNRSPSPPPLRRLFRGLDSGNTMYLGSMAFPSNLMESQGIVPPPPTHSLAFSRLNVAKRMLRRAEAVVHLLENPTSRPADQTPPDEPQEEEITPIIEARVIVPSTDGDSIDEDMVLSAVRNSILNATELAGSVGLDGGSSSSSSATMTMSSSRPQSGSTLSITPPIGRTSASSTPEEATTPLSASRENLASNNVGSSSTSDNNAAGSTGTGTSSNNNGNASGGGRSTTTRNQRIENASRTSEMAELMTRLNQLQVRFAPFLERYQNFMSEDPIVEQENVVATQATLNRVSEVLHYLGHAYHSLSDIMIRVRTPPPRLLLCRPILIQHSAVVQAGIPIPIQVEAHVNLQRESASGGNGSQSTTESSSSSTTTATTTANESGNNNNSSRLRNGPTIATHIQPTVVQLPFGPNASMRVQSFDFRNLQQQSQQRGGNGGVGAAAATPANNQQQRPNNNNNTMNQTASAGANVPPSTNAARSILNDNNGFNYNDSDVEFVMEFTPEVIRGNQPELIQSLIQMANQYMNASNNAAASATTAATTTPAPTTAGAAATTDANQSTSNNVSPPPSSIGGQNSQARGNTQTHPTTATHTRSTPRPHVHLAQQAMQGGFDPFLPCNSHHVTHRRRLQAHITTASATQNLGANMANHTMRTATTTAATSGSGSSNNAATTANNNTQQNSGQTANGSNNDNFASMIINGLMNTVRSAAFAHINNLQDINGEVIVASIPRSNNRSGATSSTTPSSANAAPVAGGGSSNNTTATTGQSRGSIQLETNLPAFRNSLVGLPEDQIYPIMAQLIQLLPVDNSSFPEGESLINDLVMIFSRNLRIVDMFNIHAGNLDSLGRITTQMRNFFTNRLLNGETTPEAIDRGVDMIIIEMQPFFQHFARLNVRRNIDIVKSIELLFCAKLPELVRAAVNLNSTNIRLFVDHCLKIAQYMCALILYASGNGAVGVEDIFRQITTTYTEGLPNELRQWAINTINMNLNQFIENLNVPDNEIQPFIVFKSTTTDDSIVMPTHVASNQSEIRPQLEEDEPMDMDLHLSESDSSESDLRAVGGDTNSGHLSNIVLGSEPWHSQVPEEWVPIITKDVQRQRRQSPQGPFSDAYLSGMPSKRRKIVNSSKPQGSLPQVIAESVRRAVTATGLTSSVPLETVAQAAGSSTQIQSAYRSLLRTNVKTNLQNNEDFTAERYPNASNYFNKPE